MATFDAVPVIDVHNDNFKELWPTLMVALKSSTFVALDLVSRDKDDSKCDTSRHAHAAGLGLPGM